LRPLLGARVVGYKLRDGVVDSRGSICFTSDLTLEAWWMVEFVFRRVPRLRTVSNSIVRSWDSRFPCMVRQEQGRFTCVGHTLDTWGPLKGYIQGSEMRARWVLEDSSATQRHPVRRGSNELPVCLGDPGTGLVSGSLPFVMSMVMAEGDLVHFGFDTWGITQTSMARQGKLILLWFKVKIGSGGLDIGIMGMLGQDELGSHKSFTIRPHERRIQSAHGGEYVIIRVAQLQHGDTILKLVGDLIITALHNSITFRDELATIGGDHADLPLGFS